MTEQTVTVSQLNEYIKDRMDEDGNLKMLCVEGEISGFTAHSSGHFYFTLKDDKCAVKAVMFKGYSRFVQFRPKNGMSILAVGDVSVFPRDGIYQLYVKRIFQAGVGDVFLAYEELKRKLEAEGLFDAAAKKQLPEYPETVAVLTSPTGAALQDIKNVMARRWPLAKLLLYPVLVQGESAAADIVEKLKKMDADGTADVAILARGGGSVEDLYVFNDEGIARAIFACKTPVISAIGHETDYTIADFVSDRRAPTPSAAAEIAAPDVREFMLLLSSYEDKMAGTIEAYADYCATSVESYKNRIRSVMTERLADVRVGLLEAGHSLSAAAKESVAAKRTELSLLAGKLAVLDPLSVLSRGYAVVKKDGGTVMSAKALSAGDAVTILFGDGSAEALIKEKK